MKKDVVIGLLGGLMLGGVVGLLWGQSTRKSLANNVQTDVESGVINIKIDAANAARQGLYSLLE